MEIYIYKFTCFCFHLPQHSVATTPNLLQKYLRIASVIDPYQERFSPHQHPRGSLHKGHASFPRMAIFGIVGRIAMDNPQGKTEDRMVHLGFIRVRSGRCQLPEMSRFPILNLWMRETRDPGIPARCGFPLRLGPHGPLHSPVHRDNDRGHLPGPLSTMRARRALCVTL